jgi:hypothetical protein
MILAVVVERRGPGDFAPRCCRETLLMLPCCLRVNHDLNTVRKQHTSPDLERMKGAATLSCQRDLQKVSFWAQIRLNQ